MNVIKPIYILILILLVSCKKEVETDSVASQIETVINSISNGVSEKVINTNINLRATIQPSFTIIADSLGLKRGFFAGVRNVVFYKNSYYVLDNRMNEIYLFDKEFNFLAKAGRKGRGPADFDRPVDFTIQNDTIFVVEQGNMRVQLFDIDFEPLTLINYYAYGFGNKFISVTEQSIFLKDYHPANDYIFQVYDRKTLAKTDSLMPIIISPFENPTALNNIEFDVNPNGTIVIAYTGLPHLFVFNSQLELEYFLTLQFEGSSLIDGKYLTLDNQLTQNTAVKSLVRAVLIDDKNNIIINTSGNLIYVLESDSDYENTVMFELGGLENEENLVLNLFLVNGYLGVANSLFGTSNIYLFDFNDFVYNNPQ